MNKDIIVQLTDCYEPHKFLLIGFLFDTNKYIFNTIIRIYSNDIFYNKPLNLITSNRITRPVNMTINGLFKKYYFTMEKNSQDI